MGDRAVRPRVRLAAAFGGVCMRGRGVVRQRPKQGAVVPRAVSPPEASFVFLAAVVNRVPITHDAGSFLAAVH